MTLQCKAQNQISSEPFSGAATMAAGTMDDADAIYGKFLCGIMVSRIIE
jgi:hypothetical protein